VTAVAGFSAFLLLFQAGAFHFFQGLI
jgi:hypothetical protein